ncbi:response regulator transcription factor [Azospirillum doebereinerae]
MALDVLVVEDHADLREEIAFFLQRRGMVVRTAGSAPSMDEAMAARQPDLVILDIGLPGEDGVAVATRLSGEPRPAVIIITARGRVEDRILGLNAGADLYLVKPLDLRELEAAITAVMRRRPQPAVSAPTWRLDTAHWRLMAPSGTTVALTEAEVRLLSPLFEAPGSTIDRQTVAERVEGDTRSIDLVVHRLRRKVESDTGEVLPLRTVHARGYVFAAPALLG